jgi:hypothetical protein
MNLTDLQQLIKKTIQSVAFDNLKELKQKTALSSTNGDLKSSGLSDDDIDVTLFHGGHAPKETKKKSPIRIQENTSNVLKITTSEIKQFENSFQQILKDIPGASVVFDKQNNGYSIVAVKRPDGVEAKASGTINLGENGKIVWSYSLLNGFKLNAQNIKLADNNKLMFEAMANHYNDWQKKWREMLNLPTAPEENKDDAQTANSSLNTSTPPVGGAGTMSSAGGAGPSGAVDSGTMGM